MKNILFFPNQTIYCGKGITCYSLTPTRNAVLVLQLLKCSTVVTIPSPCTYLCFVLQTKLPANCREQQQSEQHTGHCSYVPTTQRHVSEPALTNIETARQ